MGETQPDFLMFKNLKLNQFLSSTVPGETFVLFIKEQGCRYCAAAEEEMKSAEFLEKLNSVKIFETTIDDEPDLPAKLGLVGVPAFLKIDSRGQKRIKTGFPGIKELTEFILMDEPSR